MQRILVIDDETALLEEIIEWLTLEGYEAESATDGLEGVRLALHDIPDLIICDITLPKLDGYGVLLELRSNPSTAVIPFIFVSARAAHDDIRKGMYMGADDYITKPFTRIEMLQAIESRLEKKALQNEVMQNAAKQWQQALEDEREQRMLKTKLVAMFSHDFRTPLTTIASSASLVKDYSFRMDESTRQKHLDRVLSSVFQLTQMLDDMLVTSQMETGQLVCEPESLNVTAFLEKIVGNFQHIHSEIHRLDFKSDITQTLMLDSRLIQQIASNLISNAIKYSPKGGIVQIMIAIENQEFVLTVIDEGMGIPEDEQANILGFFQRGSNVGSIIGTGLGLAIVKHAVDLHGGTISFDSKVNAGTKFTVAIPINH